jgi:hypothetical protein
MDMDLYIDIDIDMDLDANIDMEMNMDVHVCLPWIYRKLTIIILIFGYSTFKVLTFKSIYF